MIDGYVTGSESVIRQFDAMPGKLRVQLKIAITRLAIKLQKHVKANKLSGQVLNVRTGTLRRSIDQVVVDQGDKIVGKVSTNVSYGRKHEYGFSGTETIEAHMREIKQVWGRSITPRSVQIRVHTRTVNLPERSFLRSALKDFAETGIISTEIEAAVRRAAK
jgi:hypothetical protein